MTVTTTKLTQNMMWAMTIVQKPSRRPTFENPWTKIVSRLAPRTTSGVAMGTNTRMLLAAFPRKRCRTRAKASSVPRTVATTVARSPICSDFTSDSHTPGAPHGSCQCLSVGLPCGFQTMLDFR